MRMKLRFEGDSQNVLITLGNGHGILRMGSNVLVHKQLMFCKSVVLKGSIQGLARVFNENSGHNANTSNTNKFR